MGSGLKNVYVASSAQLGAGWALVSSQTFAANSVTFSGLSGNYRYQAFLECNQAGADATLYIYVNADTTDAHYYGQGITGDGAGVAAGRVNSPACGSISVGGAVGVYVATVSSGGYFCFQGTTNTPLSNAIKLDTRNGVKTDATISSITSITFLSNAGTTSGTVKLYRVSVF